MPDAPTAPPVGLPVGNAPPSLSASCNSHSSFGLLGMLSSSAAVAVTPSKATQGRFVFRQRWPAGALRVFAFRKQTGTIARDRIHTFLTFSGGGSRL